MYRPTAPLRPLRRLCADGRRFHPDYQVFNQEGGNIRVDDIRQVRKLSFIRPSEARQKVFVINGAGNMNPQAQNALLKVLEEPQETVFLLLCEQAGQLLQTVRSRCVRFAVEELSEEQIRQELQRRMPEADPAAVQAAAQRSERLFGAGALPAGKRPGRRGRIGEPVFGGLEPRRTGCAGSLPGGGQALPGRIHPVLQ